MRFAYATGSRPLDGYTIKRGVGIGGFGEVYFAVSDAGKEVALKRIQRNLDVEIRGVSQCLNLKHPHLVAIHDIRYDDEGQAWVVMEYVRGESLKDAIERNPHGMPLAEVGDWFRGIAAGVAYLHDHGIVHRDLKPGNVFLDESIVKIGDYGLSKYISCSRRSGQTESVGTFHYMAPEIGRGVYGKEIDVYALGIILFEMLTGRVPFEGETSHEIIMKHLTAAPDLTPLPEKLRRIVQRALFKDPDQRFRSVGEMGLAVAHAVGSTPGAGTMAGGVEFARAAAASPGKGPLFIGRESDAEGMYFGPVKEVFAAEAAGTRAGSAWTDEPLARAAHQVVRNLAAWWTSPALNRTARVVVLVALAFLVFVNIGWVIPAAIVLASVYLVYFGIRAIVLSLQDPAVSSPSTPSPSPFRTRPAQPAAGAIPVALPPSPQIVPEKAVRLVPATVRRRRRWQEVACDQLRRRSPSERVMELTGSMLLASLVVCLASYLLLIVIGMPVDGAIRSWSRFAWLVLTGVLGTWAVLIPAKLWEGRSEDAVGRRFVQVLLGLAVGSASFGLHQYLGTSLAATRVIDTPRVWSPSAELFGADGSPQFPAYLVYFAGLFLLVRWWNQADPLRNQRFNLWTTAGTCVVALVWHLFWPFPQPWALLLPAAMSIAVQLSAPWINTQARGELRKLAEV